MMDKQYSGLATWSAAWNATWSVTCSVTCSVTWSVTWMAVCACDTPSTPEQQTITNKPNVVLITMDTTRKDHLGLYGYGAAKTETIDAFGQHGYVFERAYSSIPLTTPSHASMLTGLYPPHHGIRNNGDAILPEAIETLPEMLQKSGFTTVAAVSAFVTTRIWNLDQGFDQYFDTIAEQDGGRWAQERFAEQVVDDVEKWLHTKDADKPFFLWTHLYDPHHPHITHEGYTDIANGYDAEIAYMDDQIGRLQTLVEQKHPNTIWILIADHGEAFPETEEDSHGESSHGLFLYEATMHIPWIIQPYPALESTQKISHPSSVVDITTTILSMLDLPIPEGLDGVDAIHTAHIEPVYMESSVAQQRFGYHPEIAIIQDSYKLMATVSPRLFDVLTDPMEQNNVFASSQTVQIEHWQDSIEYAQQLYLSPPKFDLTSPDVAVQKQLEMLGYMGGDTNTNIRLEDYTKDAKDHVATITELEQLVKSQRKGQKEYPALIQQLETIIAREPQLAEARLLLGQLYARIGDNDKAISVFEEAYQRSPNSVILALNLANQYAAQSKFDQGIAILEDVLQRVPGDVGARSNILRMLSDAKRNEEAINKGALWLQESPSSTLQAILGVILVRDGKMELGEEMLTASLSDGIPREHVHRSLGHIALQKQDLATALQQYETELQHFYDAQLEKTLGKLYEKQQNWPKASEHHCHVLEKTEKNTTLELHCAQSLFNMERYEEANLHLQNAKEQSPDDAFVLLLEANLLDKMGEKEKAKETFERAQQALKKQRSTPQ